MLKGLQCLLGSRRRGASVIILPWHAIPYSGHRVNNTILLCYASLRNLLLTSSKMSYYFSIIGTRDNPLFELDFGTSKVGGDGIARFREEAKHMNQFIVHAAIDLVEEAQWSTKELYARLCPM